MGGSQKAVGAESVGHDADTDAAGSAWGPGAVRDEGTGSGSRLPAVADERGSIEASFGSAAG